MQKAQGLAHQSRGLVCFGAGAAAARGRWNIANKYEVPSARNARTKDIVRWSSGVEPALIPVRCQFNSV
jgi:hypothetical protein